MEVVHQGVTISFCYCRSQRRSLGLTIRPDKSVWVRVPLRSSQDEIRAFVARKAGWIRMVWQRLDNRPSKSGQEFRRGAMFPYQGREYPLRVEQGGDDGVALRGDELVVRTNGGEEPDRLAGVIDAWYRERAVVLFGERVRECLRRMVGESLPLPPIVIRSMKSRWGSYSRRTGRVCLNLNLIKVPPACLDYVIIHELCHMKEPNHGPRFWKLVSRYVPDHQELRRQLKNCGAI
jgi:predicted metal-dependent hydrolase